MTDKPQTINLLQPIDPKMINCIPQLKSIANQWQSKRVFEKWLAVILGTGRSPLALKKGGIRIKVPLLKGSQCGLGGFPHEQLAWI